MSVPPRFDQQDTSTFFAGSPPAPPQVGRATPSGRGRVRARGGRGGGRGTVRAQQSNNAAGQSTQTPNRFAMPTSFQHTFTADNSSFAFGSLATSTPSRPTTGGIRLPSTTPASVSASAPSQDDADNNQDLSFDDDDLYNASPPHPTTSSAGDIKTSDISPLGTLTSHESNGTPVAKEPDVGSFEGVTGILFLGDIMTQFEPTCYQIVRRDDGLAVRECDDFIPSGTPWTSVSQEDWIPVLTDEGFWAPEIKWDDLKACFFRDDRSLRVSEPTTDVKTAEGTNTQPTKVEGRQKFPPAEYLKYMQTMPGPPPPKCLVVRYYDLLEVYKYDQFVPEGDDKNFVSATFVSLQPAIQKTWICEMAQAGFWFAFMDWAWLKNCYFNDKFGLVRDKANSPLPERDEIVESDEDEEDPVATIATTTTSATSLLPAAPAAIAPIIPVASSNEPAPASPGGSREITDDDFSEEVWEEFHKYEAAQKEQEQANSYPQPDSNVQTPQGHADADTQGSESLEMVGNQDDTAMQEEKSADEGASKLNLSNMVAHPSNDVAQEQASQPAPATESIQEIMRMFLPKHTENTELEVSEVCNVTMSDLSKNFKFGEVSVRIGVLISAPPTQHFSAQPTQPAQPDVTLQSATVQQLVELPDSAPALINAPAASNSNVDDSQLASIHVIEASSESATTFAVVPGDFRGSSVPSELVQSDQSPLDHSNAEANASLDTVTTFMQGCNDCRQKDIEITGYKTGYCSDDVKQQRDLQVHALEAEIYSLKQQLEVAKSQIVPENAQIPGLSVEDQMGVLDSQRAEIERERRVLDIERESFAKLRDHDERVRRRNAHDNESMRKINEEKLIRLQEEKKNRLDSVPSIYHNQVIESYTRQVQEAKEETKQLRQQVGTDQGYLLRLRRQKKFFEQQFRTTEKKVSDQKVEIVELKDQRQNDHNRIRDLTKQSKQKGAQLQKQTVLLLQKGDARVESLNVRMYNQIQDASRADQRSKGEIIHLESEISKLRRNLRLRDKLMLTTQRDHVKEVSGLNQIIRYKTACLEERAVDPEEKPSLMRKVQKLEAERDVVIKTYSDLAVDATEKLRKKVHAYDSAKKRCEMHHGSLPNTPYSDEDEDFNHSSLFITESVKPVKPTMKRLIDVFGNNVCAFFMGAGIMAFLCLAVYVLWILGSFCHNAYSGPSIFRSVTNTNTPNLDFNLPSHYSGYDIPRDTIHGTVIRVATEQGLLPTDCKATFEPISPQVIRDAIAVGLLPAFSLADQYMTPISSPVHNPPPGSLDQLSKTEMAKNKTNLRTWIGIGLACGVYGTWHHYSVGGDWGIF